MLVIDSIVHSSVFGNWSLHFKDIATGQPAIVRIRPIDADIILERYPHTITVNEYPGGTFTHYTFKEKEAGK